MPVLVDFLCRLVRPLPDDGADPGRLRPGGMPARRWCSSSTPMPIPRLRTRFGIRGIPTLIAFEQGKERARHVGVADLKMLEGRSRGLT